MSWHPENYLAFDDHRTRPAAELLACVPLMAPERVVDLGCGPGNSTALLAARWPEAQVIGADSALAARKDRDFGERYVAAADQFEGCPLPPCLDNMYTFVYHSE